MFYIFQGRKTVLLSVCTPRYKYDKCIFWFTGSPVATSLCEGEAKPKHVAILKVYKDKFLIEAIKLRTVRPFVMDTVILSECSIREDGERTSQRVCRFSVSE